MAGSYSIKVFTDTPTPVPALSITTLEVFDMNGAMLGQFTFGVGAVCTFVCTATWPARVKFLFKASGVLVYTIDFVNSKCPRNNVWDPIIPGVTS